MNCTNLVSAVPRLACRRFSTGSLQYIKQNETERTINMRWERAMKGAIAIVCLSGLSFSAVNTRNMYDSRDRCKAYWNVKG